MIDMKPTTTEKDNMAFCVNIWFDAYRDYRLDNISDNESAKAADLELSCNQWHLLDNYCKSLVGRMINKLRY